MKTKKNWSIYFIETRLKTIYIGITTDVARRLEEHQSSTKGAKYLKGKDPLKLLYSVKVKDKQTAARLEYYLKRLSAAQKRAMIQRKIKSKELAQWLSSLTTVVPAKN